MTAHDRMLDPPEDDDVEFIVLDEPAGDYERDLDPQGDWGSDQIEIQRDQRYDR